MADIFVQMEGKGWEHFQQRVAALAIGAEEMARTHFQVGSTLPYASHWIEEGWRKDKRYGPVQVHYRKPAATHFMKASAQAFRGTFGLRRPTEEDFVGGRVMAIFAENVADSMRTILNAEVYSTPVPTTNGRAQWVRTHALFNSIRARRA